MNCPKCQSVDRVKNGKFKEVQKYKFKGCGCQYTRSTVRGRPLEQKLLAITLYLIVILMVDFFNIIMTCAILK